MQLIQSSNQNHYFKTDAVFVCNEVALEEVANHCVWEGRAAQLHTNTVVREGGRRFR